jgi:hypothetical protein
MAVAGTQKAGERGRLRMQAELAAMGILALRNLPMLGNDQMGQLVNQAMDRLGPHDRQITSDAISHLDGLIQRTTDFGKTVNITSSDAAKQNTGTEPGTAATGKEAMQRRYAALASEGKTSGTTGTYSDISSSGSLSAVTAQMAEMRSYAIQQGVPWMANYPEMLKLNRSDIKAIADVHLQKESFVRLKNDAGFEAKDVVTLAKFAKKKDIDANQLAGDVADTTRILAGDDKNAKHEIKQAVTGYMANDNEKNKQHLRSTLQRYEDTPEKKAAGDKLLKTLKVEQENLNLSKENKGEKAELKQEKTVEKTAAVQSKKVSEEKLASSLDELASLVSDDKKPVAKEEVGPKKDATPTKVASAEPARPEAPAAKKPTPAAPKPA